MLYSCAHLVFKLLKGSVLSTTVCLACSRHPAMVCSLFYPYGRQAQNRNIIFLFSITLQGITLYNVHVQIWQNIMLCRHFYSLITGGSSMVSIVQIT